MGRLCLHTARNEIQHISREHHHISVSKVWQPQVVAIRCLGVTSASKYERKKKFLWQVTGEPGGASHHVSYLSISRFKKREVGAFFFLSVEWFVLLAHDTINAESTIKTYTRATSVIPRMHSYSCLKSQIIMHSTHIYFLNPALVFHIYCCREP